MRYFYMNPRGDIFVSHGVRLDLRLKVNGDLKEISKPDWYP